MIGGGGGGGDVIIGFGGLVVCSGSPFPWIDQSIR